MDYQITFSDELYHHGIKGQKWGVRRFQNLNGTLTSLGRSRVFNKTARKIEKGKKLEEKGVTRKKAIASAAIGLGVAYVGKKLLTKSFSNYILNNDWDYSNNEHMKNIVKAGIKYVTTSAAISSLAYSNVKSQARNISDINAYEAAKDYSEKNK